MSHDTEIGGAQTAFPATRWSLIEASRSANAGERQRGLGVLIAAYWKPVYKHVRIRWNKDNEAAKDLTQEFFARLLEKDFLGKFDPGKARLRTYLRMCVDGLVANEEKAARREKRGGGAMTMSLDFESAESELHHVEAPAGNDYESLFEREWARSVFSLALQRLQERCKAEGKETQFRIWAAYDVDEGGRDQTYAQVAARFEVKVSDVTNYLPAARREFRRTVLETLREMTASEEEFRREARSLLGAGGDGVDL